MHLNVLLMVRSWVAHNFMAPLPLLKAFRVSRPINRSCLIFICDESDIGLATRCVFLRNTHSTKSELHSKWPPVYQSKHLHAGLGELDKLWFFLLSFLTNQGQKMSKMHNFKSCVSTRRRYWYKIGDLMWNRNAVTFQRWVTPKKTNKQLSR